MYSDINTIWMILCSLLVFLVFVGLLLLELGFINSRNYGTSLLRNLLFFMISILSYVLFGFGLMYGSGSGFIGIPDLTLSGNYENVMNISVPLSVFILYEVSKFSITGPIVSSAMAGRGKIKFFCLLSFVLSAFIYPTACHWITAGGWLNTLGFSDSSGTCLLQIISGAAALSCSSLLGPRNGKYNPDGSSNILLGNHFIYAAVGVFLTLFGWIGLNGYDILTSASAGETYFSHTIINLLLACASSTITSAVFTGIRYKKADITITFNGVLAGLVSVTGVCCDITFWGAVICGIISSMIMIFSMEITDQKLHIDDAAGSISIHGICGIWGCIATGLFSRSKGFLYTGDPHSLFVQTLGAVTVFVWTLILCSLVFLIYNAIDRSGADPVYTSAENGLYEYEHDASIQTLSATSGTGRPDSAFAPDLDYIPNSREGAKLTRIDIIVNEERFDLLKKTLNDLGVTGMTVSHVLGSGTQRGRQEYVRGIKTENTLLPKVHVLVYVSRIPAEKIVQSVRSALFTGKIGDGKIFISEVDDAIKIRTGERGYDALQDADDEYTENK